MTTTTTYGYDERGRLTSMTKGGVITNYAYNTNGDRIGEYNTSSSSIYVVDDNNPTGYSQVLEAWTGGSTPATTYVIGATIIGQTIAGTGSGSGTHYIIPDGHGSTRQLTSYTASSGANGLVVARYDYDGFGNSIIIGTSANVASTVIMYTGQIWDPGALNYDDRAREYDPRIGRFNSFDGINIAPDDIVNANMYLYVGDDPENMDDPSGHEGELAEEVGVTGIDALLVTLGFGAALYASSHAAALVRGVSLATNEIADLIGSGEQALVHEGTILASNTQVVVDAISKAIAAAGAAAVAVWEASASVPPIFPVIKSLGKDVFAFDTACLIANSAWYILNYNGVGNPQTQLNRAYIWSHYGKLMATQPADYQLDEFPFAATQQGGAGLTGAGPAIGMPVYWLQNAVQGGLLGAFTRYTLKGVAGKPFLVVPVPL